MNFNIEDDIEIEEKVHNFDDVEAMSAIENEIEVMTALIKKSKGPELDFYKTKLENLGYQKGDVENSVQMGMLTPQKYLAGLKKYLLIQQSYLHNLS